MTQDPIKKRIYELCPDLLELKRGCFFKWNYDIWVINCEQCPKEKIFAYSCTGDIHSWPHEMGEGPHYQYKYKTFNRSEFEEEKEYFEILGLHITLPDVLRAIGQDDEHIIRTFRLNEGWNFRVNRHGTADIEVIGIKQNSKNGWFSWNLLKNYDGQTRETQLFIGGLLGVETI